MCSEKGDVIERTQRNSSKYATDFSSHVRVRKHRYWIPPLEHPERDRTHDSSKQRKKERVSAHISPNIKIQRYASPKSYVKIFDMNAERTEPSPI